MFVVKRVVWFGSGFTAGLAGAWWVRRQVRTTVERYVPAKVRDEVGQRTRATVGEVRSALAEGRAVMRQYEAQARAELDRVR